MTFISLFYLYRLVWIDVVFIITFGILIYVLKINIQLLAVRAVEMTTATCSKSVQLLDEKEKVCIVTEESNEIIGQADRSVMRYFQLPHRATYVVLKNSSDQFYVQKRTMQKDYCPGKLDLMTGGVVQMDESYELNAMREVEEEMGIQNFPLTFIETFYYEQNDGNALNEMTKVWGGLFEGRTAYDGVVTPQESEVEEVLLMTMEEIRASSPNEFTPDSWFAFDRYLKLKKN